METDVVHFTRCLPLFIRLQPFAGMRLAEIEWIPKSTTSTTYPHANAHRTNSLKHWWNALPLENVNLLCIHGVQDGALYAVILTWLKQDPLRQILFLEEDPQTLLTLLHTEVGYQILSHPQIGLYWLEGGEPERLLLTQLTWDFLTAHWRFVQYPNTSPNALPNDYSADQLSCHQQLQDQLEGIRIHIHSLAKELLAFGEPYFTNFYANLHSLGTSNYGDRLFGKFKGFPILVCGSGPSLQDQIELLRPLTDRALLIAAGSAVPVLLSHGIVPHFGVAIDPTLSAAERLERQVGPDIPYFYRPRIHPRALHAIKGKRLYITGAGAYEAPLYIEQALKLKTSNVEEGYNVLHFALSIAEALQRRPSRRAPIILLGADGAYREAQEYSAGIPQSSRTQIEDAFFKTTREDAQGNLLVTRKQWIAERAWFTQFAKKHPKTFLLNATGGGLPIEGIPACSLADCIARYCTRCYDITGYVESQLQQTAMPPKTSSRVTRIIREWKQSLERIEEAMHSAEEAIAKGCLYLVPYAEAAWQSESAYGPLISLFERIIIRLQTVQERRSEMLEEGQRTKEQQRLSAERLAFLKRAVALHRMLLSFV